MNRSSRNASYAIALYYTICSKTHASLIVAAVMLLMLRRWWRILRVLLLPLLRRGVLVRVSSLCWLHLRLSIHRSSPAGELRLLAIVRVSISSILLCISTLGLLLSLSLLRLGMMLSLCDRSLNHVSRDSFLDVSLLLFSRLDSSNETNRRIGSPTSFRQIEQRTTGHASNVLLLACRQTCTVVQHVCRSTRARSRVPLLLQLLRTLLRCRYRRWLNLAGRHRSMRNISCWLLCRSCSLLYEFLRRQTGSGTLTARHPRLPRIAG
jgi:hypothetical protein